MMDFVAAFQHWLTLACFVALAVCLFALAVLCAIPELTDAIRRFCGMDNFSKVVCGVCIVGAVLYGGSKGVNVRWDDGLRDNGTLITNDTVAVRWTYSGIPGASSVFIDYREAGTTNKWLNLAETLASAQEWTGTLANATNYDYWVYSTYVPPVPVHTNGAWVGQAYETKAHVGAKSFLILNGKVQDHGRTIATPAAKRRDLPYDSEVAYLESTGTQWIDTGIYASEKVEARIDFQELARRTGTGIFGTFGVNQNRTFYLYQGGSSVWQFGCGPYSNTGKSTDTNRHHAVISNGKLMLDGVLIGSVNVQPFTTERTLLLFNMWRADGTKYADNPRRIYSFCLVDVDTQRTIIDFTPVRVGTVGAMYDKRGVGGMNGDGTARNDGLYFNRGTGNFGYGNDK